MKYQGGPVGLNTLAVVVGEEAGTLEDVYEPFLIQEGFLKRTPRGRVATAQAYRHFGYTLPVRDEQASMFGVMLWAPGTIPSPAATFLR